MNLFLIFIGFLLLLLNYYVALDCSYCIEEILKYKQYNKQFYVNFYNLNYTNTYKVQIPKLNMISNINTNKLNTLYMNNSMNLNNLLV